MKKTIAKQKSLIDKVTFTLSIPESNRMNLIDAINSPELNKEYDIKVYRNTWGRYKNNYQITISEDITIELAMYPINKSHNFIRVEYNPAKLGKAGRKLLRKFLIKLLGLEVVKTIYFTATVTRLDLTLDIFDMKSDIYMYKKQVKQSQIFRQENGDMASQVLGSDNSNCRITKYNKNLEQGTEGTSNYQRIEARLRQLNCTMADLNDDLLMKIKDLHFYNAGFLTDDDFTANFKRDAYEYGLNAALLRLNGNLRLRYLRYLEIYRENPIDNDALDFDKARHTALSSLIHPDFRGQLLNKNLKLDMTA